LAWEITSGSLGSGNNTYENTSVLICLVDRETTILWANNTLAVFLGIDPGDLPGYKIEQIPMLTNLATTGLLSATINGRVFFSVQHVEGYGEMAILGLPVSGQGAGVDSAMLAATPLANISANLLSSSQKEYINRLIYSKPTALQKDNVKSADPERVIREAMSGIDGFIARSNKMKVLLELVKKIATFNITVLLLGSSGVGKSHTAKTIHQLSQRSGGPFVELSCAAIPENLFESELFGYEPGAFTGADRKRKIGCMEIANGGTVFLDEIGDLPLGVQVKLLHTLEERKIRRLGAVNTVAVDIRIIAATSRNLEEMVQDGRFREDLFYRLNVVPILIPALKDRKEDIPPLAYHFLKTLGEQHGVKKEISPYNMDELLRYEWPGNIRELRNFVERFLILPEHTVLFPVGKTEEPYLESIRVDDGGGAGIVGLKDVVKQVEKRLIGEAMKKHTSTRAIAAALKINQSTVVRKINKYFKHSS